jgi:osmoprotectant transport system ATP-binding protein
MVNRLIPFDSGDIRIDGRSIRDLPVVELRREIGYVIQQVGLFPHMTVGENIGVTPSLLGWDAARIGRRVDELLDLVELDPAVMRDRRPDELSGGQQQRVGVARALAAEPRLMLLDEPFGALDPLTRDRIQQSFRRIRQKLSLTAIFVTHDMGEALVLGDRIAVMHEGRLLQIGTPRELLLHPSDDTVRQLMDTPRRQAAVVEALVAEEPRA